MAVLASEGVSLLGNTSSGGSQVSQAKKAKLSGAVNQVDALISSSPDLYHKLPIRSNHQDSEVSEALKDNEDSEGSEEDSVKSNLFEVKYIMWFEIGMEGKDPMDKDKEDWGGNIEFWLQQQEFSKNLEDYFILFEDECTKSHACAGRVMGVLSGMMEKVIGPPSFDPRNIVDLVDKYGDAHISDSGWREVDPEEWYEET